MTCRTHVHLVFSLWYSTARWVIISSFVSLPTAQITGISIVNRILTGRRRHPSFWETIASLPVHKALHRTVSTAKLSSIQSTHTRFAKIHFNIIHPSTHEPPKRSPSACSSYALYILCVSYIVRPTRSPCFVTKHIKWRVQILMSTHFVTFFRRHLHHFLRHICAPSLISSVCSFLRPTKFPDRTKQQVILIITFGITGASLAFGFRLSSVKIHC